MKPDLNVIPYSPPPTDTSLEAVLEDVAAHGVEKAVVIGFDDKGKARVWSTSNDIGTTLILLRMADIIINGNLAEAFIPDEDEE